jgi:uncharacterized protein YegJ (DUF2314 family)
MLGAMRLRLTPSGLALVLLALPGCPRSEVKPSKDAAPGADAGGAPTTATHPIARPRDAAAELGVLTDRPRAELEPLLAPAALAGLLDTRHCGPVATCEAVRALVRAGKGVEVSLSTTAEWGLPVASTLDTVAKGLTPKERAGLAKLPNVVVVKVTGDATPTHLVARTGFALAAALAERVHGFVHDETVRRIETADAFAAHAITAPLGDAAFRDDSILIQSYVQEDGTTRLISLGMRRFGAPDLEVRGAQAGASRSLGAIMNAVAARLAAGASEAPLSISLDDPRAKGKTATVDLEVPPLQQGDPDNTIVRIVPEGGAAPAAYDRLVAAFFGAAEQLVEQPDDAELLAARDRARRAFPGTLARWKASPEPRPKLLVKLPFPIAGDAGSEWMWVEVKAVTGDAITGSLANSPAYATDLHAGAPVTGRTQDLYDAMMLLPDGGTLGGETTKILERRQ